MTSALLNQRFRATALAATLVVAIGACTDRGASRHERPSAAATVDTLKRIVSEYKLTTLTLECLSFEPTDSTSTVFDVREKHGGSCGGDPATSPRLFSLHFDAATGEVTTDAGRPDGTMATLRAPTRPAPAPNR